MKPVKRCVFCLGFAFFILSFAPGAVRAQASVSLHVDENGDVGIGTTTPTTSLHVKGNDGTTAIRLQEESTTVAPRVLFNAVNNGPILLQMVNAARSEVWQYGENSAGKFVMREVIVGSTADEMTIDSSGNMTLTGTLTITGGCTGCDAVFQPGWPLESIEEHATLMWERGHLPAVGPTSEGEVSIDVFQKMTGMLQELEKAHIYIAQLRQELHAVVKGREEMEAKMLALELRLLDVTGKPPATE